MGMKDMCLNFSKAQAAFPDLLSQASVRCKVRHLQQRRRVNNNANFLKLTAGSRINIFYGSEIWFCGDIGGEVEIFVIRPTTANKSLTVSRIDNLPHKFLN